MRLCWDIEFPSAAMSAVAVKLADHANDEGDNVYPSVPSIERKTRLGTSTVRRTLAAFEECGLLEVVAETHGNKALRSTTVRRFNVGLLHALACVVVRDGKTVKQFRSTHVLKEIANAAGKLVWVIVERGPDDPSDYPAAEAIPAAPLPQREGQEGGTPPTVGGANGNHPSHGGRGPLPQWDPTPPTVGPKPSIEPSEEVKTPQPPASGGPKGDVDLKAGATRLIAEAERKGAPSAPIRHLLKPILDARRLKAADKAGELAALAREARDLPAPWLERAARLVLDDGTVTVKPARIREAIEQVRKGGAMVPIRRGSPQWGAWLRHFEAHEPATAKLMARFDSWQVKSEWPPSRAGAAKGDGEQAA